MAEQQRTKSHSSNCTVPTNIITFLRYRHCVPKDGGGCLPTRASPLTPSCLDALRGMASSSFTLNYFRLLLSTSCSVLYAFGALCYCDSCFGHDFHNELISSRYTSCQSTELVLPQVRLLLIYWRGLHPENLKLNGQ